METKKVSEKQFAKELQEKHSSCNDVEHCMNVGINRLINDYIIEKNAKNKAYYFILESGYFEQWREYCKNH